MENSISLRPIGAEDEDFLRAVYYSTRRAEMSLVPWTEEVKASFLAMQFDAQHRYYHQQYSVADFQLILRDGDPVGRLYIARLPHELRIVDIALLDAVRNQGIGTSLLQAIIAEAERAAVPVIMHVERFNPALRLYTRLGFQVITDEGVYLLLRRLPCTSFDTSASVTSPSESTLPVAHSLLAGDPQ